MSRKTCQFGSSASQKHTFLANRFLSLDFVTALKRRTASEPLKWTIRDGWQVSTPFFFRISSWSTCMWILSRLSCLVGICGVCLLTASYCHKAISGSNQYSGPATWCGEMHMMENMMFHLRIYVAHFPNQIQSSMGCRVFYAARLWLCLFWLAAPWKTVVISGGMPLAKHQSGGFSSTTKPTCYHKRDWHCLMHINRYAIGLPA